MLLTITTTHRRTARVTRSEPDRPGRLAHGYFFISRFDLIAPSAQPNYEHAPRQKQAGHDRAE